MSRAFRCDALDTPQAYISKKKFPHKIGPWKFRVNGHFGPNGALLGPPGAQERPDTRSKCVVTMCPTQAGQSGAVGTKSGPPGPSEDLRGPQKGHFGPKRALFLPLFDRFLKLGGSIWTITVLDEQSIPLRFSGHPTSLYFEKNSHTKLARGNLGPADISGQMGPI